MKRFDTNKTINQLTTLSGSKCQGNQRVYLLEIILKIDFDIYI